MGLTAIPPGALFRNMGRAMRREELQLNAFFDLLRGCPNPYRFVRSVIRLNFDARTLRERAGKIDIFCQAVIVVVLVYL